MSSLKTVGSRAQVMHGNAKKTSGGLIKKQLKYNKQGKIVSKKASALAKKNNRLVNAGYITRKGVFGSGKMMKGGVKSDLITVRSEEDVVVYFDYTKFRKTYAKKEGLGGIKFFDYKDFILGEELIPDKITPGSTVFIVYDPITVKIHADEDEQASYEIDFLKFHKTRVEEIINLQNIKFLPELNKINEDGNDVSTHAIKPGSSVFALPYFYTADNNEEKIKDEKIKEKKIKEKRINEEKKLFYACEKRQLVIAKTMITSGNVNVNARNTLNETPLHITILNMPERDYGRRDFIKHQRNHMEKKKDIVSLLLNAGADVMAVDNENNTPLYLASLLGLDEVVEILVKWLDDHMDEYKGAVVVNETNKSGKTPLSLAATAKNDMSYHDPNYAFNERFNNVNKGLKDKENQDMVRLLIEKGADIWWVDRTKNGNSTPLLHIVISKGDLPIIKMLISEAVRRGEVKEYVNQVDKSKNTPLHKAVGIEYSDIDFEFNNDEMPHISRRIPEIIELLIQSGADKTKVNSDGHTPYNAWAMSRSPENHNIGDTVANLGINHSIKGTIEHLLKGENDILGPVYLNYSNSMVPVSTLANQSGVVVNKKKKQKQTCGPRGCVMMGGYKRSK